MRSAAEFLRVLHKGWLLTVDEGKLLWNCFMPFATVVVLFCHPGDALFGPFLLMSSYNSLACFCKMITGISTITDCGTLFMLTLEAVGKACAHAACAPVCSWWSQLSAQRGKTIVEHVHRAILWTALDRRVYSTLLLFDSFLWTLKWGIVQHISEFLLFFLQMPMFACGQGTRVWM